jgi:predicted phage tail protein
MIPLVNRRQFDEVRRWGDALRRDEREDMHAAGEAIRLLCAEIERIGRELSAARAAIAAESSDSEPDEFDDTVSDEANLFEASLRSRLQRRLAALHR